MNINLGAADRPFPGFLSVDIVPPADIIADLRNPWPWADSSIDEVVAHDVFEHLPNKRQSMNELWRILKHKGRATIEVPSASKGDGGFCDPTHESYWTISDFEYYEKGNFARERFRGSVYYGIKADFKIVGKVTETRYGTKIGGEVYKITAVLEAVK
jgi:predicted SAM-dependent methyltransferase